MFTVIGCMLTGIGVGFLLRKVSLRWIDKFILFTIWLLLFLLGMEIGADANIVNSLPVLGLNALVISLTATAGSCIAAALLARWCKLKYEPPRDASGEKISLWVPLKGSAVILMFFAAGVVAGYSDLFGNLILPPKLSFYTLCIMILCIGISIGHNKNIISHLREFDRKILLLPLFTILGTIAAMILISPAMPHHMTDLLAVGSGQGYYSLSSVLIAQSKGAELGTIALLANVIREITTLVASPFLPRIAGPLAPIAAGGATTADSTLPVIRQVCGDKLAMVSVYHGFLVDFSVPFLVGLFCTL